MQANDLSKIFSPFKKRKYLQEFILRFVVSSFSLSKCHQLHQYVFMKSVNGQNGMTEACKSLAMMVEILKPLMI